MMGSSRDAQKSKTQYDKQMQKNMYVPEIVKWIICGAALLVTSILAVCMADKDSWLACMCGCVLSGGFVSS